MEQEIPSIALTDTSGKKTIGIGGGQTGYGFSVSTINTLQEA